MDTGYESFPNIYIGNEHMGGLDDLQSTFSMEGMMEDLLERNSIPAHGFLSLDDTTSQSDENEEYQPFAHYQN